MRVREGVGVLLVVVLAACSGSSETTTARSVNENDTPDLNVFLKVGLSASSVATARSEIRRLAHVERFDFLSAAGAREEFLGQIQRDRSPHPATAPPTPGDMFPATLQVRLDVHSQRNAVARRIRRFDGVDQVFVSPSCSAVRRRFAQMSHRDRKRPAERRWVKMQEGRVLKHGCVET